MKIIFIRHAEPDYSVLEAAGYTDFGLELAPLTARGRRMAADASRHPLLEQAEILISSSVTRALETASYLVRQRDLPLFVEPLLHEWRVYATGTENFEKARQLFWENGGAVPEGSPIAYETAQQMRERFLISMAKYKNLERVAVVAHRMLIRQFVPDEQIDYCQFIECDLRF